MLREEAITILNHNVSACLHGTEWGEALEMAIKALEQEPKTGHWIHLAASDDCSECGWSTGKYISPSKYCPNCGSFNGGEQDGSTSGTENP